MLDLTARDLSALYGELMTLPEDQLRALAWRTSWLQEARPKQLAPDGDDWNIWLLLAGRGYGKTRLAAEDIGWWAWENPGTITHVVAPTHSDLRGVCFEGESGLSRKIPPELVKDYNKSLSQLTLVNGSTIKGFSAQEASRLRGPQCHRLWGDELAAWDEPAGNAREVFDMAMFGLRLGSHPQALFTTTPRPIPLIKELMTRADCRVVSGNTYENRKNLAETFFRQIAQYEGTVLGRQEIYAEIIDSEEFGILKRSWFKLWPSNKMLPEFDFIVQSWDTAFTEKTENDPTACTTWGVFEYKGLRNVMLIDAWSEHIPYPDLRTRAVKEVGSTFGPKNRKIDIVLIEAKGTGISLIQDLQRVGVAARPYNPGKADKVQRAHAVSHLIHGGLVWLPESEARPGEVSTWAEQFVNQVCSFPIPGGHDDYVDTLTQALALLRDQTWLTLEQEDEEDYEPPKERVNPYAI